MVNNKKKCTVEGCGREYIAKGFCATHYYRAKRHGGDPLAHIPVGKMDARKATIRNRQRRRANRVTKILLLGLVLLGVFIIGVQVGMRAVSYTHLTLPTICSV